MRQALKDCMWLCAQRGWQNLTVDEKGEHILGAHPLDDHTLCFVPRYDLDRDLVTEVVSGLTHRDQMLWLSNLIGCDDEDLNPCQILKYINSTAEERLRALVVTLKGE